MAKKITLIAQNLERYIIYSLIIMMAVVLILATIDLAWSIIRTVISPPFLMLEFGDVLDLFGIFLLVLIGIELLDTIKVYFRRNVVHVEVVVLVAIIAMARKIIVLEMGDYEPLTLIGVGFIVLTLAITYYLLKRLGCEMINFRRLPESSRKIIADEIRESKKIIAGNEMIDLTDLADQVEDYTRETEKKKRPGEPGSPDKPEPDTDAPESGNPDKPCT